MDLEKLGELLVVLFVGLGGGVGGKFLLDFLKQRQEGSERLRAAARVERADAIVELNTIIATLRNDQERTDAKAELALRNERECERKWVRAVEYIQYVMFEANERGWNLRPFKEDPTDSHRPISLAEDRRTDPDPQPTGPERRKSEQGKSRGRRGSGKGPVEPYGPPPPGPPTVNGDSSSPLPPSSPPPLPRPPGSPEGTE